MYLYIYDSFLNEKKYLTLLAKIENRLADLEIKGKICHLSILKNMEGVVDEGLKQGVKTVVAVGNDKTFSKIVNIIADKDVVLGIIPVTNDCKIAEILGVPAGESACDVLAQRLIRKLDLGKINHQYFLDSATITSSSVTLHFDTFKISPAAKHAIISLSNLGFLTANHSIYKKRVSIPNDGLLEAIVAPLKTNFFSKATKIKSQSIFSFKKIKITSQGEPATVTIDQQAVFKTPVEVTVAPQKLKVIVGNKRLF